MTFKRLTKEEADEKLKKKIEYNQARKEFSIKAKDGPRAPRSQLVRKAASNWVKSPVTLPALSCLSDDD